MAEIGEALLQLLGGRDVDELVIRDTYDDFEDDEDWRDAVVDMFGSVSAGARALGVPRSTLRGWFAGRTPKRGRSWFSGQLRRSVARGMSTQREQELRGADVDSIRITGTYRYGGNAGTMRSAENRELPIGRYLDPGVVNDLVDAYLGGASAEELHEIFADAILDQGFYAHTFAADGPGGWDIHHIGMG